MVEEDGTPVLDKLDGPFFDYILDHPLFHYNCLNADLKNLNGIFLDEAQEAYVKRYYPRVKKTLTMPLGAAEAVTGGKKTETDTVLFMGTYDRPDKIYEMVELSPGTAAVLYERADRNTHRRSGSSDGGGIPAAFKGARREIAG